MLIEDHIFSVKTKDPANVADITRGGSGIVITGLNVLRDQIKKNDFVFVVFGGDKPKGWTPGLVALAHVSQEPYVDGSDEGKNFRIKIDVDLFFQPSVKRGDLVSYPDTFDTIGIGPITKWEPNQALTSVKKRNAIGLLQALCDLFPGNVEKIKGILGQEFALLEKPVRRFVEVKSRIGAPDDFISSEDVHDLREEFEKWLADGRTSPKTAYENATSYIPSIDDELSPATKQIWHGLREALYGQKSLVRIYQVTSYDELMECFGGLDVIFDRLPPDGKYDAERLQKCLAWSDDPVNHGSIRAAWRWYKKFIQWRDGQQSSDNSVVAGDRLSVALKLFKEQRDSWVDEHGKLVHELVNANVRKQYAERKNWDAAKLYDAEALKKFCIEQTWMLRNGNKSYQCIAEYSDDERKRLVDWIDEKVVQLKAPLAEVVVKDNGFKGVTNKAMTELLMKFHPDQFCLCNGPTMDVLTYLGFDPAVEGACDYDAYLQVMGCCAKILSRLRQIKIGATLDGDAPADYLVVNEFIYFVHEQKNLIKEEVMSKEFKKVEKKPKGGTKKLSDMMNDELLQRLAAALRTKPFAILAGHSGTGKSQMVRRLAYMTCADEGLMAEANEGNAPGNYCMIQVKPNWHDSTDLLGYYSEIGKKYRSTDFVRFVMKAYAYPEVPFFVCLDEMNLAPVEQYFAEYLSALESASDKSGERLTDPLLPKDYAADEVADAESYRFAESKAWFDAHGLTLPRNLFVVGTVNMDDTTCQFSRKVLDRAMTIMMDQVKFEDMMSDEKSKEPSAEDLLEQADVAKFLGGELRAKPLTTHQVTLLNAIEGVLGKTPFAVAYRFANEYSLYEASLVALTGKTDDETLAKVAMDHCVLMKVLPRIHGEKKELENLFRGDGTGKGLEETLDKDNTLSGKKMEEILERKQSYLSFWP